MFDNKQPDALDRLRRRPAPSTTPTPVAKETPLLNDEARKLLEDKTKAAALATKHAAEVGAKKSLEAGKAALGKFNNWRHERAENKAKVEAPVKKRAPLENITPAEVAEALVKREAAVPVAEAPPMAFAPVVEDLTDTMVKDHVLGSANTLKALVEDEEERGVPETERKWKWSVGGLQKVLDKTAASGGEPSGLLIMDGMGSLPATLSKSQIDLLVPNPGQEGPFADMTGEEVEAVVAAMTSARESTAPVCLTGKAGKGMTTIHELAGSHSNQTKANNPGRKSLKERLPANALRIMIVGGLLSAIFVALIGFYIANKETSAPVAAPAPAAPQVAPVIVEPVTIPDEVPVEELAAPEPVELDVVEAPAVVEPAPQAIEVAPVAPAPAVVPEVQAVAPAVAPAKPVAVEKPVAPPTPKPAAVAKTRSAVKPKAPKPDPAPLASPESKKQIDSIRDFEKQLKELGG